jgi:hypothetical protein
LEEDTGVAFAGDCREVLRQVAMLDATLIDEGAPAFCRERSAAIDALLAAA